MHLFFSGTSLQIANFILVLAIFTIITLLWNVAMYPIIKKLAKKAKTNLFITIVTGFKKPISLFIMITGIIIAIDSLDLLTNIIGIYLLPFYRSFIVIIVAWGLIKAKEIIRILFTSKNDNSRSETIVLFFTRIYVFVIAVFAILMILGDLNFDVTGILTGLGLGSLTIALAAQDSASNFFGGLIIIIERPFEVADWISADVIEGEVEDITFRSTKIRTLEGAITIVPNSTLSGSAITNWTQLKHRLSRFNLGLTYSTPTEKLHTLSAEIEEMLLSIDGVEDDTVQVCFEQFNQSSIDLMVTMYVSTIKIADYRSLISEINFKIKEIVEKNKVDFAFPSQSIYFENIPEQLIKKKWRYDK